MNPDDSGPESSGCTRATKAFDGPAAMTMFQYYCPYQRHEDDAYACGYTGRKWDTMCRHLKTKHGISMKCHTRGNREKSLQWRLHHSRHTETLRAATDATELPDYEQVPRVWCLTFDHLSC